MAGLFTEQIHPDDVASIIDFNAADDAVADRYKSLKSIQTAGVAALYNILCRQDYAYLADEVGMGKTFQALGLASIVWNMKPEARIVVVCPRKNLQTKWIRDHGNFVANNYGKDWAEGDDIVKSALLGSSVIQPLHCENLWEFADAVFTPGRTLPVLRHTSFRRVAFLSKHRTIRENWDSFYERMTSYGLHIEEQSGRLPNDENAAAAFTERFGQSFNKLLKTAWNDDKPIDLLIFDEAQYLRNPDNNSNTLFRTIFNDRVKKWLMLSATPLHSGAESIIKQIDCYPCENSPLFEDKDHENFPSLQSKLRQFLIRRPRMYVVSGAGEEMTKSMYRRHNAENDGIEPKEVITSLSMALIQKRLVGVLEGHNNRYKIGFLSSFESLQDSLSKTSREKRHGRKMDFEQYDTGQDIELESSPSDDESLEGTEAPDERFISALSRDFENEFGRPLPHPKLEHVVDSLWHDAYIGNQKVLIFVRRISTVKELEKLFETKFTALVEERVRDVWKTEIEWDALASGDTLEEGDETELIERNEVPIDAEEISPFRRAMAEGGWLSKFRASFRGQRKHALFFDENWFETITSFYQIPLQEVLGRIPENLWRESAAFARQTKKGIIRTERRKYLLVHAFSRYPAIFGLDERENDFWKEYFRQLYTDACRHAHPDMRIREYRDEEIIISRGFWEAWKEKFVNGHPLHLPDANSSSTYEFLFRRELTKNWIGQWLRLSDTVIDLYYADRKAGMLEDKKGMAFHFFEYLCSDTSHAYSLREKLANWIRHQSLIMLNAIVPGNKSLSSFAGKTSFTELNNQSPVIGMTGSSVNEMAIKQFKMPGYPQVVVCTDVLKEGEDLHLFCDKVVHYGLAWSSGDMEQRVGRVDRYFSQIERRLNESSEKAGPKLMIHYPYISSTMEQEQVIRVMRRQAIAETIMGNDLSYGSDELKEIKIEDRSAWSDLKKIYEEVAQHSPKELLFDPKRFIPKVRAWGNDKHLREAIRPIYENLCPELHAIASANGIKIIGNLASFGQPLDFQFLSDDGEEESWRFNWRFIAQTKCYALEGIFKADESDRRKYPINYTYFHQSKSEADPLRKRIRCHFPLPDNGSRPQSGPFATLCEYLRHPAVSPENNSQELDRMLQIIEKMDLKTKVRSHHEHGFKFRMNLGQRRQNVTIYAYNKMILVSSQIAAVDDIPENQWKSFKSVEGWILSLNEYIDFGELNIHDGSVCMAKRIFHSELTPSFLRFVILELARSADLYEQKIMGEDRL